MRIEEFTTKPSTTTTFDKSGVDPIRRIAIAAQIMGVSTSTLYRLAKSGDIQIIKISKRSSGIRQSEIDRHLAAINSQT